MEKRNRFWSFIMTALVACVVAYCAFYFIFLDLLVDLWWFRSLDYEGYFWLRSLYRYLISGGVTLLFFGIFFLHFWIASRYLGLTPETLAGRTERHHKLRHLFRVTSVRVYTPLSLILAVIVAIPFYQQWEQALLFVFGSGSGVDDPVYSKDVSFYLFSLPMYQLIQTKLLLTAVLLFLFIALMYWIEHQLFSEDDGPTYPLGAKIHLSILWLFVCLFVAWGFMLQRYGLLYTDAHEPVFFGPGFVEIRYHLPLIWLALVTFLCAAVSVLVLIHTHGEQGKKGLLVFAVCFLLAVGLRAASFLPSILTQFVVQPNPVDAEKPFMQHNIDATLTAYDLNQVKNLDFEVSLNPKQDIHAIDADHLKNIPLWDRELLGDVYKQLQSIRPYYNFPKVNEDRYLLDGHVLQVNLGAREVNIDHLPDEARNWENTHLSYTHGYGVVMTPAAQPGDQPMDWYIRDLNLKSKMGFKIDKPDVYYGMENYPYAIVPNELEVQGLSSTVSSPGDIAKGGIPIQSLFRKLLFAFYFGDEKIFFSTNINRDSKMRIRRNVIERIDRLAPYLAMDEDPYLTVTSEGLFWIQDAYTTSDWYPVSKRSSAHFRTGATGREVKFNYIRNSVKIIVSAYDGSANFYIVDPKDPMIQAYNKAYPHLFKSLAEIPDALKPHLRYPREIFFQQMKVYAKYHQTDPELFYQQAETWQFAELESAAMKPYYLTAALQGCSDMQKFVLVTPMTPIGRNNLSSLAIAGSRNPDECGQDYSPKIRMFNIHKDIQVDGPAQISARIDQDPIISEQFTLWDQRGSEVKRGRMILLPVGQSILYVQPVYLVSTSIKIPELKRVIVSMGNEVVMDKSLELAFKALERKFDLNPVNKTLQSARPESTGQPGITEPGLGLSGGSIAVPEPVAPPEAASSAK